jgi:hypothetical protein
VYKVTTMTEETDPEVATAEMRQLLIHLDPQSGGGHKDRVRSLARFRTFASGDKTRPRTTPEFYDDDLPLLFLGSLTPVLDDELVGQRLYGLLQACGTPSNEHEHMLKRSARPAMALLKYLVCDFAEFKNGTKVQPDPKQLNPFAHAICSLLPSQLSHMRLELHVDGDKRGGAKEDACHVISLLVTRHLADDGETTQYVPLETLLPSKAARIVYQAWLKQSAPKPLQKQVNKALAQMEEQQEAASPEKSLKVSPKKSVRIQEPVEEEESLDQDFRRTPKKANLRTSPSRDTEGPPMRWEDSALYQEQVVKAKATQRSSARDAQQAAAEEKRQEKEKLKAQGKDPLGLKPNINLREIQSLKIELLEQAVKDLDEEIRAERNRGDTEEEHIQSLEAQKDSLEHILDTMGDMDPSSREFGDEESKANSGEKSIILSDSNFDPLLFLTLVHRNANYDTLMKSIDRLSSTLLPILIVACVMSSI